MAQIRLENGILLDDQDLWAPFLQSYAMRKGLTDVRAFVATDTNGAKSYLIVDGQRPEFETQSYEAAAAHIDIMWLAKIHDEFDGVASMDDD